MISAAVLIRKKKLKLYSNISLPKLDSKQVLVKMCYSGICGSQLFEINGLSREMSYRVLKLASYKLPIKTKIVEKI